MAIDQHIEEIFDEWIISMKDSITKKEGGAPPVCIMLTTESPDKSKYRINVMPLPEQLMGFGKDKDILVDLIKFAAKKIEAVAVMLFVEANMLMIDEKDKDKADAAIRAVRNETRRVEDMPGNIDILMCLCETHTKQIAKLFQKIPTDPITWKDTFGGDKPEMFLDSRFAGFLYKQPINKKFSDN